MNFEFTEEQLMIREMVRKFADQRLRPLAEQIDRDGEIPRTIINEAAELGLLGMAFDEQYGGSGAGELAYCLCLEELAKGCASTTITISAHQSIGAMAINLGGSHEQKLRWLKPCAEGKKLAAFALTEPNYGSDAANIQTFAEKKGDHYLVNGAKVWITNGGIADVISLFVRTDRNAAGAKGLSALVIEKGMHGFSTGPAIHKMGIRGSNTTELYFENVKVPVENLLGTEGQGLKIAMGTLNYGRLTLSAASVGAAKEALSLAVKFASERKQFGEPIANKQAIQCYIGDMASDIFAMESIVYRTSALADSGKDFRRESAICKLFCTEALDRIVDLALQIHGGCGYVSECKIERMYRDARINRIFEGTNEIQRLSIAAEVIKAGGVS